MAATRLKHFGLKKKKSDHMDRGEMAWTETVGWRDHRHFLEQASSIIIVSLGAGWKPGSLVVC